MGWRGTLRGLTAVARSVDQANRRRERQHARLVGQANGLLSSLEAEVQRDAKRVQAYEDKVYARPVNTMQLEYTSDGRFVAKPFEDRTGNISFCLQCSFGPDAVSFEPKTVAFEGRVFEILACAVTQYATFIAFDVRGAPDVAGSKSTRLVCIKSPADGKVAIVANGQIHHAFDGTIDGPIPGAATKRGIIAFQPFSTPVDSFELYFMPKESKRVPDPEPLVVKIAGEDLLEAIGKLDDEPSFLDNFHEIAEREMGTIRARMESEMKKAASSGCLVVLATFLSMACVLIAVFVNALGS